MRHLSSLFSVVLLAALPAAAATYQPHCAVEFEGEVAQGASYVHPAANGLDFMLEAVPAGWIVRMLQHNAPRTAFDYAWLANPPYLSPNPILISTDFSFRAQDAIGWNPREFHYFATNESWKQAIAAYNIYSAAPESAGAQQAMGTLLSLAAAAPAAKLQILEAHLIGGTANQTQAAALVASHFIETPHVTDSGTATALGAIHSIHFHVTVEGATICNVRSSGHKHR